MNSIYFPYVFRKTLTGLLLTSAIALTGCGGGGGGGSSSSSSAISSAVLANVTTSSTALQDGDTVGGLAFTGTDGTTKALSMSVGYSGGTLDKVTVDGTDYTPSVNTNSGNNTYSAMLSFEADGDSYNNVVVGSPTETANITNAATKSSPQTMTGTTEINVQVAQTTGDETQTSVLSLSGTSNVTINFSEGTVTTALSNFLSGTCTGTCGATDGSTSTLPISVSPFSLSITDASITNSGFSGGTLSVTDSGNDDNLNVDFGTLGFDSSTVTHGGQFFGEVTVGDDVLPKEAGGNFHAATSEGDWIQGGYLASQ